MKDISRLSWNLQNVDLRAREEENGLWMMEYSGQDWRWVSESRGTRNDGCMSQRVTWHVWMTCHMEPGMTALWVQSHVEQLLTAVWVRCHVTCMNEMPHGTTNDGCMSHKVTWHVWMTCHMEPWTMALRVIRSRDMYEWPDPCRMEPWVISHEYMSHVTCMIKLCDVWQDVWHVQQDYLRGYWSVRRHGPGVGWFRARVALLGYSIVYKRIFNIYIYVYIYMYVYIYIYIYMYMCVCMFMYTYFYVYTYVIYISLTHSVVSPPLYSAGLFRKAYTYIHI